MLKNAFIDWLTITQHHQASEPLPIVQNGIRVDYNAEGIPIFERASPRQCIGSFDTSVRVSCDGFRVSLSGNVGRFARQDNLYGFGISQTIKRANAILALFYLPPFTVSQTLPNGETRLGASVSRLDFTVNYATGSEFKARQAINSFATLSVSRVKKGRAGDESYWFANTRYMFKAYIKHLEMLKHGASKDCPVYQYALNNGILRLELELKRRLLGELNMRRLEDITDEKLEAIFEKQTEFARKFTTDDFADALEHIPTKSRIYAESWHKGIDLKNTCSRATLFRHAKVLREYGIDILADRNIEHLTPQIRFVDLIPLPVPNWYHDTPDELIKKAA